MSNNESNPFNFDWGDIFVDSYNTKTKNATIIYNFNFNTKELIEEYFKYSVAHIYWTHKNIPNKSSITAIYDLRGIIFDSKILSEFEARIKDHLSNLDKSIKANLVFHN